MHYIFLWMIWLASSVTFFFFVMKLSNWFSQFWLLTNNHYYLYHDWGEMWREHRHTHIRPFLSLLMLFSKKSENRTRSVVSITVCLHAPFIRKISTSSKLSELLRTTSPHPKHLTLQQKVLLPGASCCSFIGVEIWFELSYV